MLYIGIDLWNLNIGKLQMSKGESMVKTFPGPELIVISIFFLNMFKLKSVINNYEIKSGAQIFIVYWNLR